jgi:hypothetical protein
MRFELVMKERKSLRLLRRIFLSGRRFEDPFHNFFTARHILLPHCTRRHFMLLPRLRKRLVNHRFFVDGTPSFASTPRHLLGEVTR